MSNIKDVAKMAGVSITTVSKVLSNTPYVSSETRERVVKAIRELHFSPNLAARSLLRQQSFITALFLPYVEGYSEIDPYLSELIRGAEQQLGEHEYSLLLSIAKSPGAQHKATTLIQSGYVDGVLTIDVMPSSESLAQELQEMGVPAVANGYPSSRFTSVVHADDEGGAQQVIDYLLAQGHRRIGIIGVRSGVMTTLDLRLATVRQRLAEAGYPLNEEKYLAYGNLHPDGGMRACSRLLKQDEPPTAIYAFNDHMALGALQQAQIMGFCVPETLSIVGNDDLPLARLSHPTLTTVAQPVYQIGAQMANRLVELIKLNYIRRKQPKFETIEYLSLYEEVLKSQLIIRQSSGPVGNK